MTPKPRSSLVARLATAAILVALLAIPLLAGNPFWIGLAAQVLIFGLLALSVDLLMRHTGLFPMCHGAFFAVGAYVTAMLEVRADAPSLVAAGAGVLAATAAGALFGVSVRTSGVYFILVTLAFGQIVWGATVQWSALTGGDNGIPGVPYPSLGELSIGSIGEMYALVCVVVILATLAYARLVTSPFGLALNGIRDSESRMSALGFDTSLRKYVAFVISSAFAGLAGVLYAYTNQFVSPASASLLVSVEAALMAILGGAGTLLGPFIGSVVILGIRNLLSGATGWPIVMGLVFIGVVLFAPKGIVVLWRQAFAKGGAR